MSSHDRIESVQPGRPEFAGMPFLAQIGRDGFRAVMGYRAIGGGREMRKDWRIRTDNLDGWEA
jgi:hypothetical protein